MLYIPASPTGMDDFLRSTLKDIVAFPRTIVQVTSDNSIQIHYVTVVISSVVYPQLAISDAFTDSLLFPSCFWLYLFS
jgi:hypothetical protein